MNDHRAEGTERRQPHDEAERREEHVCEAIDAVEHDTTGRADAGEAEAAQHGQQQHRQHLSLGEGTEERRGNDVRHEFGEAAWLHLARILGGDRGIELLRVDMHAGARLQQEHYGQAGQQGEDRERMEQPRRRMTMPICVGCCQGGGAQPSVASTRSTITPDWPR